MQFSVLLFQLFTLVVQRGIIIGWSQKATNALLSLSEPHFMSEF